MKPVCRLLLTPHPVPIGLLDLMFSTVSNTPRTNDTRWERAAVIDVSADGSELDSCRCKLKATNSRLNQIEQLMITRGRTCRTSDAQMQLQEVLAGEQRSMTVIGESSDKYVTNQGLVWHSLPSVYMLHSQFHSSPVNHHAEVCIIRCLVYFSTGNGIPQPG